MVMHVCDKTSVKCEPLSLLIQENDRLKRELTDIVIHYEGLERNYALMTQHVAEVEGDLKRMQMREHANATFGRRLAELRA